MQVGKKGGGAGGGGGAELPSVLSDCQMGSQLQNVNEWMEHRLGVNGVLVVICQHICQAIFIKFIFS